MLEDWRTAPVNDRVRATLGFLQKLTLTPQEVGPGDVEPIRATGVSDAAIRDAVYVCALFNVIDRVADSLDFAVVPEQFTKNAKFLLKFGYRM